MNDKTHEPRVSVIIPFFNSRNTLGFCLDALLKNDCSDVELILVDDGSTDGSAEIATERGIRVYSNTVRKGPAAARNHGSIYARGNILVFLDSDVMVQQDTLKRFIQVFDRSPELSAVFGSYDDKPDKSNFLSQYKNLMHHFMHQNCRADAVTFWAGCGAVRRDVFQKIGGFNEVVYREPSIEDIELGIRLYQEGHKIRLEKTIQVKHLKRWNVKNLLHADIVHRAIPWSRLIFQTGILPNHLNLQIAYRISAILVTLSLPVLIFQLIRPHRAVWFVLLLAFAVFLYLNRKIYAFLLVRKGFLFALLSIFWQWSYYLYSTAAIAGTWIWLKVTGLLWRNRREPLEGRKWPTF